MRLKLNDMQVISFELTKMANPSHKFDARQCYINISMNCNYVYKNLCFTLLSYMQIFEKSYENINYSVVTVFYYWLQENVKI